MEKDASSRIAGLITPRAIAFVYPILKPKLDDKGEIQDIGIISPKNYTHRQLMLAQMALKNNQ